MSETPNPFLRDNYAPWPEEQDIPECKVVGEIPDALEGTFYRNGPNPQFPPRTRYHWFDGDAMIHAFSFSAGKCRYRNRWVRSEKFLAEQAAGESLFGGLSDILNNDPRAAGVPFNPANTHLVPHAGRLLALFEGGPPTEIDPRTLDTIGIHDFDDALVGPVTAHPHVDPVNGEMVFFGYSPVPPFLRYHVADASGKLVRSEVIDVPVATMMHDLIVTREHVVFMVCPATFRPEHLASGMPIRWEPELGTRLGVMPRNGGSDDLRWFELPPCYVFHPMNAFDDGSRIVADVCRFDRLPILQNPEQDEGLETGEPPILTRWTLDLADGSARETPLEDQPCDFPRLDDRHALQPYGFGIACGYAESKRELGLFDTVIRYDAGRGRRSAVRLPGFIGEAVFTPRNERSPEGEGFVMTTVWHPDADRSDFVILDAENLEAGPLATVELPHRVPHGFHANYWAGVTLR
ncbi:MAG: carotenoid oxygenase family protein [Myxococcales bacterium]|nr:carotenoid oxygenase family protein [Myxococcales bacterium]